MASWTVSGSTGIGTRYTGASLKTVRGELLGIKAVIPEVELVAALVLSSVKTFGGAGNVGLTPGVLVVELLSVGRFAWTAVVGLATAVVAGGGENVPTVAGGAGELTTAPLVLAPIAWLGFALATGATGPIDKSRRNSRGSD